MKNDFIYCKNGFNVIRIPAAEYNNKTINPENVEVLMWKNGERVFEKNDLSELICNEENLFALEWSNKLDELIDKDIENLVKEYKEIQKPQPTQLFTTQQYYKNMGKGNCLRLYVASSQLANVGISKRRSRKKNKKAYNGDLVYKYF